MITTNPIGPKNSIMDKFHPKPSNDFMTSFGVSGTASSLNQQQRTQQQKQSATPAAATAFLTSISNPRVTNSMHAMQTMGNGNIFTQTNVNMMHHSTGVISGGGMHGVGVGGMHGMHGMHGIHGVGMHGGGNIHGTGGGNQMGIGGMPMHGNINSNNSGFSFMQQNSMPQQQNNNQFYGFGGPTTVSQGVASQGNANPYTFMNPAQTRF